MSRTAPSLCLVVTLATLAACGADEPQDSAAARTHVATAAAGDLAVELLTDGPGLGTGLNPVYLRITDGAGQVMSDADVTFVPEMAMSGGTSHGAPVIGAPAAGADGVYRVEVVFQMATSAMGSWSAAVGVTRPATATVEATFAALPVADRGASRTFTWWDPDASATAKFVTSLNLASAPRVGLNPVVLTLYRMQDMMMFVPVADASMSLHPWMPSMGHGASGSVDPVHTGLGRYEGELAFSMDGEWVTTVTISRSTATPKSVTYTTSF